MNFIKILFLSFFLNLIIAQEVNALPAQINAIKTLAKDNGFSDEELNNYLFKNYGKDISTLTREQAIKIITSFKN